jgi:hypothetical protein
LLEQLHNEAVEQSSFSGLARSESRSPFFLVAMGSGDDRRRDIAAEQRHQAAWIVVTDKGVIIQH